MLYWTTHGFLDHYETSREWFRDNIQRRGWVLEEYPIGAAGPDGKSLTCDVGISTGGRSDSCLIVSSGVHGVEGPLGVMAQLELLDWELPDPPRIVLIHSLNPFGFAHSRRFTEDNIDLNRNFLRTGEEYRGAPPGYFALEPILNPRTPPTRAECYTLRAAWTVLRQGMPALRQAVAAGQYEYPRGLFFGGTGPAEIHQILKQQFPRWLGSSERFLHLDFHSGLGRWAEYKLLLDTPLSPRHQQQMTQFFRDNEYEVCHADGISYQARGGFGEWCTEQAGDRDYLFLCVEFGTYPALKVLAGLREENRAEHWCAPDDPRRTAAQAKLRELFFPASAEWRQLVYERTRSILYRSLEMLGASV